MSRPEDRFDAAIDRAVREMLDVEPPAGLRGRVMQRIDPAPSGFSRKILWAALPLAAAAALILAVLLPRTAPQSQRPATVATNPPAPRVESPAPPRVTPPAATVARTVPPSSRGAAPRAAQRPNAIVATSDATDVVFGPEPGFPRVTPMSIAPLTVSTLRTVPAAAVPQELTIDPIATPAPLTVEPLSLSPRERQEQE